MKQLKPQITSKQIVSRARRILLLVLVIVALALFFKRLGPYGEGYLPQWAARGNILVEAVEAYKQDQGHYPESLPVAPDLGGIPGCKNITYIKHQDKGGSEYFIINMFIHLREAVIYDSRKNLNEESSFWQLQNFKRVDVDKGLKIDSATGINKLQ